MNFSLYLFGIFIYMVIVVEKTSCRKEKEEGEIDAVQRILQSILKKPAYKLLDHIRKQQIIISFFNILKNLKESNVQRF